MNLPPPQQHAPAPSPAEIDGADVCAPWRLSTAFFLAGFGTFALIYDVQPMLPEFPRDFGISPATASLSLSLTTLLLSASMLVVGRISEIADRRRLMSGSIVVASLIGIASAFASHWGIFLLLRALMGVALGGLPAVALAYLADNVRHSRLAMTVGLYVGGTGFGGMVGRLLGGVLTEHLSWQHTVGIVAGACGITGILFFLALPAEDFRKPVSRAEPVFSKKLLARFAGQWRDPTLRLLFIEGGLLLGCFIATYNYLCFRLKEPPFNYSGEKTSLVFLMYFVGMIISPLCGKLIARFGIAGILRAAFLATALGALAGIPDNVWCLLVSLALVTGGFFAGHSTASAWVSRRAASGKAIASAQYLTVYYIGASLLGWLGGYAWQHFGWTGVAGLVAAAALLAVAIVPNEYTPPPQPDAH